MMRHKIKVAILLAAMFLVLTACVAMHQILLTRQAERLMMRLGLWAERFMSGDITDLGLRSLSEMWSLRSLGLSGTRVTDAGLKHLSRLTALERLRVGNTQITDAGLVHLTSLTQLERLSLGNTEITDEGIKLLAGMTHLRELCLAGTRLTQGGVEWLQRALPKCKIDVVILTL